MIKKITIIIIIFLSVINFAYSFTQIISPNNNSIQSLLNVTIKNAILGNENTSTWINWNNSLIAYWNFDSGNFTHVFDLSGNGNNGVYDSGVINTNSNQIRGDYSHFDGSNDMIRIHNLDLGGRDHISISFWFNFNSFSQPTYNVIFSQVNLGSTEPNLGVNYHFGLNRLSLTLTNQLGTQFQIQYDGGITLNRWYFLTMTYNSSDLILYLDSNKIGNTSMDGNIRSSNQIIALGCKYEGLLYPTGTKVFNSNVDMDEIIIFNRTLSENEIKSLYNSQLNNFEYNISNLNDLTNYSYEIFTINSSGNLKNNLMNFFTNTSYTIPQLETIENITNIFPSVNLISLLFGIILILFYLIL